MGWEVLMTGDEACLHNPDPTARTYLVRRPHLPAGSRWQADGDLVESEGEVRVTVPAASTVTVRSIAGRELPSRHTGCSIFTR